jgi:hypothetical protein
MDENSILPPDISPSPWKFTQGGVPGWKITDKDNNLVCFSKDNPYEAPNAEFIIWARNNIQNIIYDNEHLRAQTTRLRTQTRQIRKIYKVLVDIEKWLVDSNQPDTYIQEFKKLVDETEIFRESAM